MKNNVRILKIDYFINFSSICSLKSLFFETDFINIDF
jgi:hypothetical protein